MRIKLTLAALIAVVVMAFATTSASARNFSTSHSNLYRVVWSPIRFMSGGLVAAACSLTLEGSFHYGSMGKVLHSLTGFITRASIGACTTGSATVLTGRLPWHATYEGFEGVLPDITSVRVLLTGSEYRIHEPILGTECLARTTTTEPSGGTLGLTAGSGNRTVTGLTADPNFRIRCGALNGSYEGTARVTEVPGGLENLLVRLI